jgi:predicted  nucleic acid-binding Zn-ribbon protein
MGLVTQYWKIGLAIAVALVFVSMLGYIKILKSDKAILEKEKDVLKIELSVSQQSVKDLSAAIDKQNAATIAAKKAADEKEKLYLAEIARAKQRSEDLRKQAEDLMKRQLPQGANVCNAANSLFSEEINRAKK